MAARTLKASQIHLRSDLTCLTERRKFSKQVLCKPNEELNGKHTEWKSYFSNCFQNNLLILKFLSCFNACVQLN